MYCGTTSQGDYSRSSFFFSSSNSIIFVYTFPTQNDAGNRCIHTHKIEKEEREEEEEEEEKERESAVYIIMN